MVGKKKRDRLFRNASEDEMTEIFNRERYILSRVQKLLDSSSVPQDVKASVERILLVNPDMKFQMHQAAMDDSRHS